MKEVKEEISTQPQMELPNNDDVTILGVAVLSDSDHFLLSKGIKQRHFD